MPAGYLAGWFLRRLMKGRSVAEIERGFWYVVLFFLLWMTLAIMADLLLPKQALVSAPPRSRVESHSSITMA